MFLNTYFFTGLVQYCYGQSWLRPKGSRTTSSEGSTNSVANASKRHSVAFASSHNSAANSSNRRSVANASNRHSVAYDNIHSSSANASYLHPVAHDNSPISASCPGSGNSSRSSTPTKMLEPVAEKAPVKNPPPVPTRRIHSAQPYRSSTGVYCTIL